MKKITYESPQLLLVATEYISVLCLSDAATSIEEYGTETYEW